MTSKRLIISSAVDWLVIVLATIISLLLPTVNPDFHTFCLLDMNISYPYRENPKLNLPLLILLSIIFPVLIIIISISFFAPRHLRIQNLNASLLGLGVSLATSTVIFTGVKNLTGKPRPNFLAICDPDLENIGKYKVGGFGTGLGVMVNVDICRQRDEYALRDGFRSFPSGYATIAFAGLWYLSLFLWSRFCVAIPPASSPNVDADEHHEPLLSNLSEPRPVQASKKSKTLPVYMLLLPYIPLGLAIFIAGTRYFDFRNHGFDVSAGAAIGWVTAYFGFRIYHPSLYGAERDA